MTNMKEASSNLDAINFHQFSELGSLIRNHTLLKHHSQRNNCIDVGTKHICNIAEGVSEVKCNLLEYLRLTAKAHKNNLDILEKKFQQELLIDMAHTIK